ncbi:hypothetical protein EYC80_000727 [Monilinia laxa]|uniref:Uncharacterized protein n=1 Tax=Monilinia laxa TaxID=61186 RepID=A0A5N6KCR4_MONLA|nr:hypothetical protein EYC80_000727 [Monilinia laxa]
MSLLGPKQEHIPRIIQTSRKKQPGHAAASIADDSEILVTRQTTLIPLLLYPAIKSFSPIKFESTFRPTPEAFKINGREFDDSASLGSLMESDSSEDSYEDIPDVKLWRAPRAPSNHEETRFRAVSQFDDVASLDSPTESDSSEDSYEDIPDVVLWKSPPPKSDKPKSSQRRRYVTSQRIPSRSQV